MEYKDDFDEIMLFKQELKSLDTSFLRYDIPQWNPHRYEIFAKCVGIELNKKLHCKYNFSVEQKFGIPYLKLLAIYNGISKECEMELSILYYKNVPVDLHITVANRFVELFTIDTYKPSVVSNVVSNNDNTEKSDDIPTKNSNKPQVKKNTTKK